MDIPADLERINDNDIAAVQAQTVSQCTDDKDRTREAATVNDSIFSGSSGEFISFSFVNTRLGIPDKPNCTEEDYLDDYEEFNTATAAGYGIEQTYGDRVRVSLGGAEYVRDTCTYNDGDGVVYFYVRKLDDDLMCVIQISAFDEYIKTPEHYEALFK